MGLTKPYNLEIGCRTELGREDWASIYQLLKDSFKVDDDIYRKALVYRDENIKPRDALPDLNLTPNKNLQFSILSLPTTDSPEEFFRLYNSEESVPVENIAEFMHDMTLYDVQPGTEQDNFYGYLRGKFKGQPFTQAIVELIKSEGSARFGLVNEWIQSNCSDKPTPYRWELKPATRRLYNWLEYFYEEISWDRPHYSMVIRWKEIHPNSQ